MKEFLLAGGWPTWVVLIFGGVTLAVAARFALAADPRKLGIIRSMTAATTFAVLGGVASDLMAVLWGVSGRAEWAKSPDMPLIVMRGFGEAITPAILGFTILSLVWMLVAVGMRRRQDPEA